MSSQVKGKLDLLSYHTSSGKADSSTAAQELFKLNAYYDSGVFLNRDRLTITKLVNKLPRWLSSISFDGDIVLQMGCKLTTLADLPSHIIGFLFLTYYQGVDLQGCPQTIGELSCRRNKSLKKLNGIAKNITGDLDLSKVSNLTSLDGLQNTKVGGNIELAGCTNLKSLEFLPRLGGDLIIDAKEDLVNERFREYSNKIPGFTWLANQHGQRRVYEYVKNNYHSIDDFWRGNPQK